MNYAVQQRLRFIDFLLFQYGHVNRSALMEYFGISMPQASKDLQDYFDLAPANAAYDRSGKCYVRTPAFTKFF